MAQPNNRNSSKTPKLICELPPYYRNELCRILDHNDKWEKLGAQMKFDRITIHKLQINQVFGKSSPTSELLTLWDRGNRRTILELYILLVEMKHKEAIELLEKLMPLTNTNLNPKVEKGQDRNLRSQKPANGLALNVPNSSASPSNMLQNDTIDFQNLRLRVETEEVVNMNQPNATKLLPDKVPNLKLQSQFINLDTRKEAQNVLMKQTDDNKKLKDELKPNIIEDNRQLEPTPSTSTSISSTAILCSSLQNVPFDDLKTATGGWNARNILGRGGFGEVYKGFWRSTQVAIKRTKNPGAGRIHKVLMESIENELKNLNRYRHDNILPIYGFSIRDNDVCLIYQYMANGSLLDRLFCRNRTKPLNWFQRLKIATGTARGLQFLHDPIQSLVHGDIKSANILLDANFEPKIGDFGFAREGPYKHYTCKKISRVRGTIFYLPDEFLRNKEFSTKVDVYSFGMVLFELATGLLLCDTRRPYFFLKDLIINSKEAELKKLADKKAGLDEFKVFKYLIGLGTDCVKQKPKERPTMVLILNKLELLVNLMIDLEKRNL